MIFRLGAVSLVALTLVSAAVRAQEEAPADDQTQVEGQAVEAPAPELPQEILDLLNDQRPLAEMDAGELRRRMKAARGFMKQQGLPDDVRQTLQGIAKSARAELDARDSQPAEKTEEQIPAAVEQPVEQTAPPQEAQPEPQPEVLPAEEVVPQPEVAPAQEAAPVEETAPVTEPSSQPVQEAAPVEEPAPVTDPAAAAKSAEPAPQTPPPVDKVEAQELDGNAGKPEAEAKAKAFLSDDTNVESLSDEDLRARLDGMRDLMAGNELSRKTERALRKKLKNERDVLRKRMAAMQAAEEEMAAKKAADEAAKKAAEEQASSGQVKKPGKADKPKIIFSPQITINTSPRVVLADRRRSEELSADELRRRVEVYRDVESEEDYEDYDPGMREYWRQTMRRDRELLRRRLLEERQQRYDELASADDEDFDIEDEYQPGRKVPRNVFEAEADDQELEDILVAPPRRKVRKKYTIEDIAEDEQLRDAMPRIEIDTIRFGFNEAFVREEEVENLDRIAEIIERILRKRPREIFVVEGHTDAVGSDAYNLRLSRARAEAVKRALTSYFVIPARNLQAVGLGERYLKIPTAEAEPENRRVSIGRGTPMIGELEE